ncbi:MAG: hypothetical protein RL708_1992, partial [Bacteroidota bacterium]
MALIIIGLIILIAAVVAARIINTPQVLRITNFARLAGLLMMALGVITACFVQVDSGHVGVKALFGKVEPDVLTSGMNFVNPLMDVKMMDIKTQNYTMSAIHDEGNKQGDDAIRVLTADGLEVVIDLTILYRVVPTEAPNLLREVGLDYTDKIVRPITRTRIRDNAVSYDAVALYSTKREEFQVRISKSIEDNFKNRGLILEQLLIRNISLPASVKGTIEEKIQAEQEAQKMQFVLQKEKQEAERKRVEAQGIADYQHIISEGLTDKQLQYEQIKA